ncbi:MAG: spore germination protein [Bacillota bacterium]|nr:spore germination protein [Bacillota bacterium]
MAVFPIPVEINTISGGVVQFGPSLFTSPKSSQKTFTGSGLISLAIQAITVNGLNSNNTIDSDGFDQPIVKD